MKRIAFITYEYPPDTGKGGIGTYTLQTAGMLAEKGWEVHVFAASNYRTVTEKNINLTVHLIKSPNPERFRYDVVSPFITQHQSTPFNVIESPEINSNASEIKRKIPELTLIVRLHAPNYLVENLKKVYIPFIAKLRYFLGAIKRGKYDLGYWRPYKKEFDTDYQFVNTADYITAPSEAMKEWAVRNWKLESESIHVIPNLFFPPAALLEIPIIKENKYKIIIFYGRLNVLKGLVNATFAMRKILKENADWKFLVVGNDENGPKQGISMRTWMKRKLASVQKQVEYFDGIAYEKLPDAILESEIILLPSLFESFSYTCAEAMAAGKAVVGSKVGGMNDLLENGAYGLLADPYSYNDIYKKLSLLINVPERRFELSVKGRKRILDQYCNEKIMNQFDGFYRKLIQS